MNDSHSKGSKEKAQPSRESAEETVFEKVPYQPASIDIWDKKYRLVDHDGNHVDETMDDTRKRVARDLASVEKEDEQEYWYERFLWAQRHGAIGAGRITSNAGASEYKPETSLINCTVSNTVEDDMNSIMNTVHEAALTLKRGSGIGYSFSTLRPKGDFVAGAGAQTSGPLSFMDIYDKMCFTIASAGNRRGAQMATFDVQHPDVVDYIRAKREDGRLRQFNLSLLITDEFMKAVENDEGWPLAFPLHPKEKHKVDLSDPSVILWREWPTHKNLIVNEKGEVACRIHKVMPARALWNIIMSSTYDYAEPGFILIDKVNEENNNWWMENIQAANPCVTADTKIWVKDADGEVNSHPIGDLEGQEVEVWNGRVFSKVRIRQTGQQQRILRFVFSNGTVLDCTFGHTFVLEDGSRIEARMVPVGVNIAPFSDPDGTRHEGVEIVSIVERERAADKVFCFTDPIDSNAYFNGVMTGNCGEQMLPPYGSCLLGSVNLASFVHNPFKENASFNWDLYREVVSVFTRMLDNVVEKNNLPLEGQRQEIMNKRRHGMGFLGLGSALTMLRTAYGSPQSLEFTERVAKEMALIGWEEAVRLSEEKGAAPALEKEYTVTKAMLLKRPEMEKDGIKEGDKVPGRVLHAKYSRYMQRIGRERPGLIEKLASVGARFTHHTSIAPTGTISLSLGNNVSNGIEPSFAHHYSRNVIRQGRKTKEKVDVFSFELLAYRHLVNPDAMPYSEDPKAQLPDYFVTADAITPKEHVDVQAAAQPWIDSAISKTANVPTDFPYDKFKDIYLYAYKRGLKGCTTFRFNPDAFQGVLVREKDLEETLYTFKLADGTEETFRGNEEVEYEGETHTAANLYDALKEGYYGRY